MHCCDTKLEECEIKFARRIAASEKSECVAVCRFFCVCAVGWFVVHTRVWLEKLIEITRREKRIHLQRNAVKI